MLKSFMRCPEEFFELMFHILCVNPLSLWKEYTSNIVLFYVDVISSHWPATEPPFLQELLSMLRKWVGPTSATGKLTPGLNGLEGSLRIGVSRDRGGSAQCVWA